MSGDRIISDLNATPSDFSISPVNIRDEVYRYLRQQIIDHKFPPGYRLNLPDLEKQLGISRTPIKEALQRLETEGLIEIRSRRGTFVSQITFSHFLDNYQIRHAVERYIAQVELADAQPPAIEAICTVNDRMRALSTQTEYQIIINEYMALDQQFHSLYVKISPNKRLIELYERASIFLQLARIRNFFNLALLKEAQLEHDHIQDALKRRDQKDLSAAIDVHIEGGIHRLKLAMEQAEEEVPS